MPLFELEDGPHRKFYRIERAGNRLELHWGRIGTAGQKKTLELATELEARREYEEQIFRRRERGYRVVVDEAAPHDSDEAHQRALAATGALTQYPRFVFRHAKKKRVTWIEVRGATVVTASGAPLVLTERACASPQAALRLRDQLVTGLVGKGYVLDDFGAAEPPVAKRRASPVGELLEHAGLEAALAESPDDPDAWLVYEDWLLANRDPRAAIIEHEHAHAHADAAQARGAIKKLLLGKRASALDRAMTRPTWRAGFVRTCGFEATGPRGAQLLAEFLTTPAAKFLTELDLVVDEFATVAQLEPARLVRALSVHSIASGQPTFDAKLLAPFRHLGDLRVHQLGHFAAHDCLAQLRALLVTYSTTADLAELAAAPLQRLSILVIHAYEIHHTAGSLASAMADLVDLTVITRPHDADHALGVVLESGLVARLERLKLYIHEPSRPLTAAERASFRGGALATLAHVELPLALLE
jgi:uncharacterized protein (TIGR02996 family)